MNITVITPPPNFSGIYAIRCVPTGKVYVGSARWIAKRWRHHRETLRKGTHHNSMLQRAWDKYGVAAFEFTVLDACEECELSAMEQLHIDAMRSADRAHGFNLCPIARSNRGIKFTGQALQNIRDAAARRKPHMISDERRKQLADQMRGNTLSKGYRHTEETRSVLREISARPRRPHAKIMSPEGLAKRALKRGIPLPDEHRRKIAAALSGKRHSDEHRRNLAAVQKAVSDEKAGQIRALRAKGLPYKDIAQQVGCTKSTACRVVLGQGAYA